MELKEVDLEGVGGILPSRGIDLWQHLVERQRTAVCDKIQRTH